MPEFHARIPEQRSGRQKVLAREIELEEIDTPPFRTATMKAIAPAKVKRRNKQPPLA